MSVPYEILKKDLYICLQRSVINPDLSTYQSEEYINLVAKDLNTGIEKYIFDDREAAEKELKRLGTNWNLCVVKLPINKVGFDKTANVYFLKGGGIGREHIEEIALHPLLRRRVGSAAPQSSF